MYFIYVLKSHKDEKLYYGLTKNITNRLREHNNGNVKATRSRIPFDLVYHEEVDNLNDARKREKYFKGGFGRKYIKGKIKKRGPIV